MELLTIGIAVFVGITALVGGVATMMRGKPANKVEDRLDLLTGATSPAANGRSPKEATVLARPLDRGPGFFETFLERFGDVNLLFEQADTSLTVARFVLISAAIGIAGAGIGSALGLHVVLVPVAGCFLAAVPLFWVLWRRKRRLKQFAVQLPDALEMIARSLRAGQSLGFGLSLVSEEMGPPIGKEFGRAFEEQNLGVPLEEALKAMSNRIPNLDLKFFVTAVVLQRQTGGDLAEILDKIGGLIRERFQVWGQIQALTGEGRLSGIILLALPIVLFVTVYQLNPSYVEVLFTDPTGTKLLTGAILMQIAGALVIRKIINIKV